MNEPTKKQEEALREFLHSAIVPLIEGVLVKKLGQAMSYAKEQLDTPKREWVGLTDDDVAEVERWVEFKEAGSGQIVIGKLVRYIELKLRSKNNAV